MNPSDHYRLGRLKAFAIQSKVFQAQAAQNPIQEEQEVTPRKRDHAGRGKARGRQGGRRRASTAGTRSSSAPPHNQIGTQEEFDRNMARLAEFLPACPEPEPSPRTWSRRQKLSAERWKEAQPHHLQCLLKAESVGQELCWVCHRVAVIRCRDCLPNQWLCEDCDILQHNKWPLHNRDSVVCGFVKPIAPSTTITRDLAGQYVQARQACILPTVPAPPLCSCEAEVAVSAGREVIVITMNGRFDLHLPVYSCRRCLLNWTPNTEALIQSGYWPASLQAQTLYSVEMLRTYEELKRIAPGFSRYAFCRMLEQRSEQFGRSGAIKGDLLQRSFLQYASCIFELEKTCGENPFICPACTPDMVAVCADGNRKLYRFQRATESEEPAHFDGVFLAKDLEVAAFVDLVRSTVKSTPGKGTCGESQWAAARETSRRTSKLDEEGVEVAVCRHGTILKGLNMFRGEIFAYPLFLQNHLHATSSNISFFAMDVACLFWPYLEKAARIHPSLQPLLQMEPLLSIMHAHGHSASCQVKWSARNKAGAGTTAGEEVEQVNSYLSRCALSTKYMSKAARVDMLTVHAIRWNKQKKYTLHEALSTRFIKTSKRVVEEEAKWTDLKKELQCSEEMAQQWVVEVGEWAHACETRTASAPTQKLQEAIAGIYQSIVYKKSNMYRQNDSREMRSRIRQRNNRDKQGLLRKINEYNTLVAPEDQIDRPAVEGSLAMTGQLPSLVWPWEEPGAVAGVSISIKRRLHNQLMLKTRLEEEKGLLVKEMIQHCCYLQNLSSELGRKILEDDNDDAGVTCLLNKRLAEVEETQQKVLERYRMAVGRNASSETDDESEPSSAEQSEDEEANEDQQGEEQEEDTEL